MNKTTECAYELQESFRQTCANTAPSAPKRLPKVTFLVDPVIWQKMSAEHREAWRAFMRQYRAWRVREVFDPKYRTIAGWFGKSISAARRYIKDFARWGLLVIEERRRAWNRNDTNVYKVVDSTVDRGGGCPSKMSGEKPFKDSLKTNTPADRGSQSTTKAKETSLFERLREKFRAERRAFDLKVSLQMRAEYEAKGRIFAERRENRQLESSRMAVAARLGMYTGPKSS